MAMAVTPSWRRVEVRNRLLPAVTTPLGDAGAGVAPVDDPGHPPPRPAVVARAAVPEVSRRRRTACAGCGPSTRRARRAAVPPRERSPVSSGNRLCTCTTSGRTSSSAARRRRRAGSDQIAVGTAAQAGERARDRRDRRCSPRAGARRRRPRRSQRTSSSTARFSPDGTRDEYRLWTTRTLMVWPSAHEWTARVSDLTLRSPEWSSDGSELGAVPVRCGASGF